MRYCLDLAETFKTDRVAPVSIFPRAAPPATLALGTEHDRHLTFDHLSCRLANRSAPEGQRNEGDTLPRAPRAIVARLGIDQFRAVNKETLLAHIHSRLECLPGDGRQPTPENGWLATPCEPVNLADYGLEAEPQTFSFAAWCETPNPAFDGRTPQQVINEGTEAERNHLADAVDAIAALLDGAFS